MYNDIIKKKDEIPTIKIEIERIKITPKIRKLKGCKASIDKNGNVYIWKNKKHIGYCLDEYDEEICQDCYAEKSCLKLADY